MRKKIVAGNWKMNNDLDASIELVHNIIINIENLNLDNTRVIVAPTFVNLHAINKIAASSKLEVAAQNIHQAKNGAFTGEVSAKMLTNINVNTVILGHSERRRYFGETDQLLAKKVATAITQDLDVLFCFGEQLEDRKSGNHFKVVEMQISNALFQINPKDFGLITLAYEPVWAIGTGETASPEQAQEMHAFIRGLINNHFGNKIAENTSILYGGSVKAANAKEIFSKPDVDGGLIGGASLDANDFTTIIKAL